MKLNGSAVTRCIRSYFAAEAGLYYVASAQGRQLDQIAGKIVPIKGRAQPEYRLFELVDVARIMSDTTQADRDALRAKYWAVPKRQETVTRRVRGHGGKTVLCDYVRTCDASDEQCAKVTGAPSAKAFNKRVERARSKVRDNMQRLSERGVRLPCAA